MHRLPVCIPSKCWTLGAFFFSPMCIAFKTEVCILLIVRAAFLDDGLKKIWVLFWVVAVLRPSGLEGSVSSGSLWPGAEQKRDPGLKMAADRQVQPTEPDKGTNDTQRCHHLWRKNKKNTHIDFNMVPRKEGSRKIKTRESLSDTKVACCARTSGTVHTESIHYNSSVHACWPPFGMLEGIISGVKWRQDWRKCNAPGTEGCERLSCFQCMQGSGRFPQSPPQRQNWARRREWVWKKCDEFGGWRLSISTDFRGFLKHRWRGCESLRWQRGMMGYWWWCEGESETRVSLNQTPWLPDGPYWCIMYFNRCLVKALNC